MIAESLFATPGLELLEERCGVYFLVSELGEVVYVGQSTNIHRRILGHKDKSFSRVFFLPVKESELGKVEQQWIQALKPKYNRSLNTYNRRERETVPWEPEFLGFEISPEGMRLLEEIARKLGVDIQGAIEFSISEVASRNLKINIRERDVLEYVLQRGEWPTPKKFSRLFQTNKKGIQ